MKYNKYPLMEELINSAEFKECQYGLPVILGKDIAKNKALIEDLNKIRNILILGHNLHALEMCLLGIMTSLLSKKSSDELKFLVLDPRERLVNYTYKCSINERYFVRLSGEDRIVKNALQIPRALKSLYEEMNHRYTLLRNVGVRDIEEYNEWVKKQSFNGLFSQIPYIVTLITDYDDICLCLASNKLDDMLCKIIQQARAVGIFIIVSMTKSISPFVDAQISFRLVFRSYSENGYGSFEGHNDPVEIQYAFVKKELFSDINVEGNDKTYYLPTVEDDISLYCQEELDPLFSNAATIVVVEQIGSTSLIQRRLCVGYNRAGRLMDQLERMGIVGSCHGAIPREVFIPNLTELEMYFSK